MGRMGWEGVMKREGWNGKGRMGWYSEGGIGRKG
jgi:hypothetical protein